MGVRLTGWIEVPPDRLEAVRAALPAHIRLTRAEPGCLAFEVTERTGATGVFDVAETFCDQAAFDAHQRRAADSDWAKVSEGIPRHYEITSDEE